MRNGVLCCFAILLAGGSAHAQWPAYAPQGYPAYAPQGYPAYGPQGFPGYAPPAAYPAMRPQPGFYPGHPGSAPFAAPSPYMFPQGAGMPQTLPGTPGGAQFIPAVNAGAAAGKAEAGAGKVEPKKAEKCETTEIVGPPMVDLPFAPLMPAEPEAVMLKPGGVPPAPEPSSFHRPHHDHLWLSGEYLASWIRRGPLAAPLVTNGFRGDAVPGAIGQPGTVQRFGGDDIDYDTFSGFRAGLGLWMDHENRYSLSFSGFWLAEESVNFSAASDAAGNPVITRPFVNAISGQEGVYVVAFPAFAAGRIDIQSTSQLYGGEVNFSCHSYCHRRLHLEGLVGFRTLRLEEDLRVRDQLTALQFGGLTFQGNFLNAGDMLSTSDQFATSNTFYGFQTGGKARWEFDWFVVDLFGKVAFGANNQRVDIDGQTTLITPAGVQTANGGVLALPSNSGAFRRHVFSLVPEAGINIGVDAHPNVRLLGGYSLLYWTNVVRPGRQIDRTLNPAQVPSDQAFGAVLGPPRPAFSFQGENFWAHTFNFGLEFHY